MCNPLFMAQRAALLNVARKMLVYTQGVEAFAFISLDATSGAHWGLFNPVESEEVCIRHVFACFVSKGWLG